TIHAQRDILPSDLNTYSAVTLPVAAAGKILLGPPAAINSMPRPDPARLAFNLISGASSQKGGLWVSGDQKEGLSRLRWIVGRENADLIILDESGRIRLNRKMLQQAAGADEASPLEAPLIVA